jgi:hypothetical protein
MILIENSEAYNDASRHDRMTNMKEGEFSIGRKLDVQEGFLVPT